MEQPIQQTIQEKSESKPPIKTNWKFIVIVAIVTLLLGGGAWWYGKMLTEADLAQEQEYVRNSTGEDEQENETVGWQTYRNEEFGFEVRYPSHWKFFDASLEGGYDSKGYSGEDGFFEFLATEDFAGGINEISKYEAYFDKRYGSNPIIESLKVDGQEAKLILPSDDQSDDMKNRAALVIRYPTPVVIQETKYGYLVVWADAEHINQILSTFRFID